MKNNTAPTPASMNSNIDKVVVTSRKVACDGPAFSGHPRIFLTIGAEGDVVCPYCSRHFILSADAQDEAH